MLVIRRDQLEALAEPLRRRFSREVLPRLRELHPAETNPMDDARLAALVEEAFRLGARYGLDAFDDVETCARLLLAKGPGFDEAPEPPELREILTNEAVPGGAKARWLRENLLGAE